MDEIATLRSEVEALTTKLAALEARLPPPAKPVTVADLAIVGQTYANRPLQPCPGFIMPTDKELTVLCLRVRKHWPVLNNLNGLIDPNGAINSELANATGDIRAAEYLRQMRLAFIGLTYFKRTPDPDHRRYITHWIEETQIVLADMGKRCEELRFAPFVCAAIMHGDIAYTALNLDGQPLSLGLSKDVGAEAKDAWKRVLDRGPADPVGRVNHAPSRHDQIPVRITQGV